MLHNRLISKKAGRVFPQGLLSRHSSAKFVTQVLDNAGPADRKNKSRGSIHDYSHQSVPAVSSSSRRRARLLGGSADRGRRQRAIRRAPASVPRHGHCDSRRAAHSTHAYGRFEDGRRPGRRRPQPYARQAARRGGSADHPDHPAQPAGCDRAGHRSHGRQGVGPLPACDQWDQGAGNPGSDQIVRLTTGRGAGERGADVFHSQRAQRAVHRRAAGVARPTGIARRAYPGRRH